MAEMREEVGEELDFGLKEIVWAKIIGYPWWPAKITQVPSEKSPYYRVDFFNDHTQYQCPNTVRSFPKANWLITRTCANISICIVISIRAFARPSLKLTSCSKRRDYRPLTPSDSQPLLKSSFSRKNNYLIHHKLQSPTYKRIFNFLPSSKHPKKSHTVTLKPKNPQRRKKKSLCLSI
jgi:hypothetical protein